MYLFNTNVFKNITIENLSKKPDKGILISKKYQIYGP